VIEGMGVLEGLPAEMSTMSVILNTAAFSTLH
jgi:hypothetical protein